MGERLKPGERRISTPNRETGAVWVTVSREEALAHPKGQLNWVLYLIICYLVVAAGTKAWFVSAVGGGLALTLAAVALPLLTAWLMWLRAALARVLVIASGGLSLFQMLNAGFVSVAEGGHGGAVFSLVELVIILTIVIYMWEGERPNLIYANRYRSYRRAEQGEMPGGEGS